MRAFVVAGALAVGALLISSAGAVPSAGTITIKVPIPGPQHVAITRITLKGSGNVKVRTANDAQLGNLAALYVVQPPHTIFVLLRSFGARRIATAAGNFVITVDGVNGPQTYSTGLVQGSIVACAVYEQLDGLFESGASTVSAKGRTWTLSSGRSKTAQPSPPESVLDDFVSSGWSQDGCSGKAPESYDPGNT